MNFPNIFVLEEDLEGAAAAWINKSNLYCGTLAMEGFTQQYKAFLDISHIDKYSSQIKIK